MIEEVVVLDCPKHGSTIHKLAGFTMDKADEEGMSMIWGWYECSKCQEEVTKVVSIDPLERNT